MCIRVGQNSSFCFFSITEVETGSLHKGCHTLQVVQAADRFPCRRRQDLPKVRMPAADLLLSFCLSNKARAVVGKGGVWSEANEGFSGTDQPDRSAAVRGDCADHGAHGGSGAAQQSGGCHQGEHHCSRGRLPDTGSGQFSSPLPSGYLLHGNT